jgi:PhnB protein
VSSRRKWVPRGFHSVTPRLIAQDVPRFVEFLRQAFGAAGELRTDRPCQMRIGDSLVMVSGAGPRDLMPAFLYLYVDDADAVYRRALAAGARSLEEPVDTPYGDRRATVKDPSGNIWQIATHMEERRRPSGSRENKGRRRPARPRAATRVKGRGSGRRTTG